MFIDTHVHLTQLAKASLISTEPVQTLHLSNDLIPTIPVISVSTDLADSIANIQLCKNHIQAFPAVGLHPWFVSQDSALELDSIKTLVDQYQLGILGEIGLDFSKPYLSTKSLQLSVFEQQLVWASEGGLSVSLHIYKGYDEAFELLKRYSVKGALHGFAGGFEQAKRFVDLGFKIGVNTVLLHKHVPKYVRMIKNLSIENLILETDAPNISRFISLPSEKPLEQHWFYIEQIAQKIANIKQCSFNQVAEITTQNAIESFNFEFK